MCPAPLVHVLKCPSATDRPTVTLYMVAVCLWMGFVTHCLKHNGKADYKSSQFIINIVSIQYQTLKVSETDCGSCCILFHQLSSLSSHTKWDPLYTLAE